ncbi:hypothetical protein TL18_06900 [Methanobrevibacter sp. YE315]|uniref:hypothetical protein n=1 Tax=Methanobrevibacter sp. YE315 TaxID=1609968 RepID=UPI000764E666|nr:hypothetical protein [Methanobrevibacter sp. YE315]AMD17767.1 hypothetical protein TL18_06900 [Methanobrevibacter sp. YE315]
MNVFNYKKRKISSPKITGKHKMYRKKTPQNKTCLDDFVGKFKANEKINSVDLKKDFKRGVF